MNKKGSYQLFFFGHANKKSTKLFFMYEMKLKTGLTPSLSLWIHFYSFLLLSFSILFCSTLLFASWIKNQSKSFLLFFCILFWQFYTIFLCCFLQSSLKCTVISQFSLRSRYFDFCQTWMSFASRFQNLELWSPMGYLSNLAIEIQSHPKKENERSSSIIECFSFFFWGEWEEWSFLVETSKVMYQLWSKSN